MNINDIITESGLGRIYKLTQLHDYGTITAYRYAPNCGTGTPYTYRENQQRNQSLLANLRARGYGVTSIKGSYIENYGSPDARELGENSFLVIDIQNKGTLKASLTSLGQQFEQDSIIFGKAGKAGVLIGTNHCPNGYPGFGNEVTQGGAIFGQTGEFMSRVNGRPFVFAESQELVEYSVCKYPTELRGPVAQSKKPWSEL